MRPRFCVVRSSLRRPRLNAAGRLLRKYYSNMCSFGQTAIWQSGKISLSIDVSVGGSFMTYLH
jgi:hypothetical protein